jgi:hypothetical protein
VSIYNHLVVDGSTGKRTSQGVARRPVRRVEEES